MKNLAYAAVIANGGYTLGIAKRDEPGYYSTNYSVVPTWDEATKWADIANERLGLTKDEALDIVVSSMRAQNIQGRHSPLRQR